ncbi:hypothetical protein JVU11DRAFT_9341 [Chiua virens]|nr:hypothetical protein JVU11DRAFT_9341 [Chiua virens]
MKSPQTPLNAERENPSQRVVDEVLADVLVILEEIRPLLPVEEMDELSASRLAKPIKDLQNQLVIVRALEPKVKYIPKVLISLDAHLNRPLGRFPDFTAIANGDTSVNPEHPWLTKVLAEADASMDGMANPKLRKSIPCPHKKGELRGFASDKESEGKSRGISRSKRKRRLPSPHQHSAGDEPADEGELPSKGKHRGRRTFEKGSQFQSTQPSAGVEPTREGKTKYSPSSDLSDLSDVPPHPSPPNSDPHLRTPTKRTFEASRSLSPDRLRPRNSSQPPGSLPPSSSQACGTCGWTQLAEDRVSTLEGTILQLLYAMTGYGNENPSTG